MPAPCERLDALPGTDLDAGHRVAYAKTRRSRSKGLARLDELPTGLALHIPKCRSVHTVTMRFPLDLVWLAKDGTPVRVDRDVPPNRLRTCLGARSVVECNAGEADAFVAAGVGRSG
jgi:uncharacterized protein